MGAHNYRLHQQQPLQKCLGSDHFRHLAQKPNLTINHAVDRNHGSRMQFDLNTLEASINRKREEKQGLLR